MTKTILKIMLVAGGLLTAGYFFNQHQEAPVNDMIFANVEALASIEGESFFCGGSGSIDCVGDKVEYKRTGLSLK